MRFCARGDRVEQQLQAVFGFDVIEIRAVGPKLSEKRRVVGLDALSDDGNAQPRDWWWLGRHGCSQAIRVTDGGGAKRIELMRAPQVRRQLFDKLRRRSSPNPRVPVGTKGGSARILETIPSIVRAKEKRDSRVLSRPLFVRLET